jgi:hypothetical protein
VDIRSTLRRGAERLPGRRKGAASMGDMAPAGEDTRIRAALDAHRAGALTWLAGGLAALLAAFLVPLPALVVLVLVVGGATAAVIGVGALARSVRWRAAVQRGEWRPGRLRLAGPVVASFEPDGYDELDPDARLLPLRLLTTLVWRARAVERLDGAAVRVAPAGRGQWLLTGDGVVFGARTRRR